MINSEMNDPFIDNKIIINSEIKENNKTKNVKKYIIQEFVLCLIYYVLVQDIKLRFDFDNGSNNI